MFRREYEVQDKLNSRRRNITKWKLKMKDTLNLMSIDRRLRYLENIYNNKWMPHIENIKIIFWDYTCILSNQMI
jgi:hypothetical protein